MRDPAQPAHVALDVGLEVVAERLPRLQSLVVNPGIEPRVDDVVYRLARAGAAPLGERERQQAEQRGAPGQRLADGVGKPELLAAREHEQAIPPSFVGEDLEVRQELGDMLDLVDDRALAQLREEAARVRLGKVALVGRLQIGVLQVGEGRTTEGRLAGLAWPGHGHERVLSEQRGQPVGDVTPDHRARIWAICTHCK